MYKSQPIYKQLHNLQCVTMLKGTSHKGAKASAGYAATTCFFTTNNFCRVLYSKFHGFRLPELGQIRVSGFSIIYVYIYGIFQYTYIWHKFQYKND